MKLPLLVTYRGMTIGNGFVAEVEFTGRAVADLERDGAWIYGVTPGGIAEGGSSLDDAHVHFRETLRRVMIDFAEVAPSFAEFKAEAERFFHETTAAAVADWQAAVDLVRAAHLSHLGLPKKAAETETYIRVTLRPADSLKPALNNVVSETAVADPAMADAA